MANDDGGPSTREFAALPESADGLSKDLVYSMLSNARRRYILLTLLEDARTVDVSALVDAVTIREYDESYTYTQRKRVYVSVRQTHLPALQDAGVIEYDADRGTVRRGPHFETVTLPLRLLGEPVATLLPAGLLDGSSRLRLSPGVRPSRGATGAGTRAAESIYHGTSPVRQEPLVHGLATVLEFLRILL